MCGFLLAGTMLNDSHVINGGSRQEMDNGTGLFSNLVGDFTTPQHGLNVQGGSNESNQGRQLHIHTTPAAEEYHIITGALLIICAIIATIGNSIVITVIVRVRRYGPDTVTHILILNLATTHLLLSLLCTPLEATFYLAGSRWLIGEAACRIVGYLKSVFVAASVVTLSNIAVDRYYSVVYPLERKITTVKRHLMVCYTWGHAIIICIPYIVGLNVRQDAQGRPVCEFQWYSQTKSKIYLISYSTLTIFLPLIVTSLAYYLVWQAFRQSQRKVNVASALKRSQAAQRRLPFASKTEIRLLKTLLLMVFCFVLLWTPYLTYLFLSVFSEYTLSEYFVLTSVWISRVQPVLDPLIYGYLNNHFKRCFFEMLNNLNATRCCKLPQIAVTTNERPTISSEQKKRSMLEGTGLERRPVQVISTITNLDGTEGRSKNDVYVSYLHRSNIHAPTANRVYVQSNPRNAEDQMKGNISIHSKKYKQGKNDLRGRAFLNDEIDIMEEKQVRRPTVKLGLSSVPSWACSSNNAARCKPDQRPSVVIQHAKEEVLRIDYYNRFPEEKSQMESLEPKYILGSRRRNEEAIELRRLPPGDPMRSPLAVKRLPPINMTEDYRKSEFQLDRKSEFCAEQSGVSGPSTSGVRLNGGSQRPVRKVRKKRRNFLMSRVKNKYPRGSNVKQ